MADRDNLSFWERCAAIYGPLMGGNAHVYRVLADFVRPYVEGADVLELACGTGQLTAHLYTAAHSYTASDFSPKMVERAKKHISGDNITFVCQDATQLNQPVRSFDVVIMANALHIMPEPAKALKEVRRVLREEGMLYAPTFVYQQDGINARVRALERAGLKTYNRWSADALSDYLENNGFVVQQRAIIGAKPLPECAILATVRQ